MLRKSLASLPQTLDQTYDRILTAIVEEDSTYAMRMLQWLTFSERPLTVEEIAEVVAIDVKRNPAFDSDEILEDPLEALNICSSLVVVTTREATNSIPVQRIIGLAHYSVQEYLVSDRIRQGQAKQYSMSKTECHSAITKGSLMYLLQLQQRLSPETLGSFALAGYAAKSWHSHYEAAGEAAEEGLLAMNMMSTDSLVYLNWFQLADPDNWEQLQRHPENTMTPLHFAASHDLIAVTRLLLSKGADIHARGGWYGGSALHEASSGGLVQIVNMLLDKGADVDAQSNYGTALRLAVNAGRENTVEVLLNRGADPNAPIGELRNIILPAASSQGHRQIVKMLLERGVDPNMISDGYYARTALQEASAKGHEDIVRMLLDHKADVNICGKFKPYSDTSHEENNYEEYSSALHAASANGHYRIVKMLLDAGAQGHQEDGHVLALK